jgi:hypothetical protein
MALSEKQQSKARQKLWDALREVDTRIDGIIALDAATVETNTGATGLETLVLPVATVGMEYIVERVASFTYRVDPNGTEKFAGSTAGKYKSLDSDGAYINIKCLSTGIWHVMASSGTISDE